MRGTILSSSKAFGFGKGANNPTATVKENKFLNAVDHAHNPLGEARSKVQEEIGIEFQAKMANGSYARV